MLLLYKFQKKEGYTMNEKEKKLMEELQEKAADYEKLIEKQKARNKQSNDIIKNNYDRVSVILPKGTKERVKAAGESVNGLVNRLVLEFLETIENK